MLGPQWFMRASRWARNPPSAKRVKFVLAIIALCALLFVIERTLGWPEWLTPNARPGRMLR